MSEPTAPVLAIDIETATLESARDDNVDFQDTQSFDLVAVGLGYRQHGDAPIESTVCFRRGRWSLEATTELLRDVIIWTEQRPANATLTYNGKQFDAIHLREWARRAAKEGLWPEAVDRFDELFTEHIDLARAAMERYGHMLERNRSGIRLDLLCEWEQIDTPTIRFDAYALDDLEVVQSIDDDTISGRHVGKYLGEAYIDRSHTAPDSRQTKALEAILRDYTRGDIEPLFKLADSFDVV